MTRWLRHLAGSALALAVLIMSNPVAAAPIVLTFEGLADWEGVADFYNGGTGSLGSGPGSNHGIRFTNAIALIDSDAGGSGNFGGEPSPSTAITFLDPQATSAVLNIAAGFDTGFSFFYTAINSPGSITVWDGLDGTGTILATLDLPLTPFNGAPDPNGQFSPFLPIGVVFNGIARSVDFSGTANQIGFDDITIGSATPGFDRAVPEPGSLVLLAAGLVGLGVLRRQHGRRAVAQ
jgi:PEP-CTERM motif